MRNFQIRKKIKSGLGWISLFRRLFLRRGDGRYGYQTIHYLINRFEAEACVSRKDLEEAEISISRLTDLFRNPSQIELTRFGSMHDGGYFLASPASPKVLVSGGAGRNIDFELELAENGCIVHIFDHTVKNLPKQHSLVVHHKKAIYGHVQNLDTATTLEHIISNLGLLNTNSNYLKLDIEGSEWDVLDNSSDFLEAFEQIVVEFHDFYKLTNAEFRNRVLRVFEKLNENFSICHSNGNNWRPIVNFGSGAIPEVLEVTLIRKDLKTIAKTKPSSASVLNHPGRLNMISSPMRVLN